MYLKGFSDAVVPGLASPEEQVEAILNWMAHGPTRRAAGPVNPTVDRDPADTLNYASLLKVCGSATNAFINLADSGGLVARRLLLLDSRRLTQHVVAEVLIDGRWIVVDPAFRAIPHDAAGGLLTREQLNQPSTFAEATSKIPNYDPDYTYGDTVHVRIGRVPIIGSLLRRATDRFFPQWEQWATVSLLLERESLAACFIAIALVLCVGILRVFLRRYGETRLGIRPIRFRQQVTRAFRAFLETPS
jgi:Transglutaminase-like superfamily